jgi:hypothetical protein
MLSNESTVVAIKEQVSCDVSGEAVIMSLKDGMYYGLDPVGARIWNLIQAPRAVLDLQKTIQEEYEVEPERCHMDLLELLKQFEDHGLIEVLAGGKASGASVGDGE